MSGQKNSKDKGKNNVPEHIRDPGKIQRSGIRQDRLGQALRANLKRRKTQIKGRADVADAPVEDDAAFLHDESESGSGQ